MLIVLLVMAVVLIITLSVASRSITDISLSRKEEDSARAFSAAEAGIERTLASGVAIAEPQDVGANSKVQTTITAIVTSGKDFQIPFLLSSGETAPIWFVSHNSGALICDNSSNLCYTGKTLKLCWGEEGTSASDVETPAIELTVVYTTDDDYSSAKVARAVFDPYTARPNSNNFTKGSVGTCSISNENYAFSQNINLQDLGVTIRPNQQSNKGPQMARVRLIYNTVRAHPVGIGLTDDAVLPRQGDVIESTGTVGVITRRIQVFKLFPDLPPIFDYAIFAGTGGLTK